MISLNYKGTLELSMGKKGIEIVAAKIDINEVISDLNKAYADEWCWLKRSAHFGAISVRVSDDEFDVLSNVNLSNIRDFAL